MVLKRGSRGALVDILQLALSRALGVVVEVDGCFGAQTRLALLEFQRAHALPPTGEAGSAVWHALEPYTAAHVTYAMRRGESFAQTAESLGAGLAAVETANPGLDLLAPRAGQRITVPLPFDPVPALAWSSYANGRAARAHGQVPVFAAGHLRPQLDGEAAALPALRRGAQRGAADRGTPRQRVDNRPGPAEVCLFARSRIRRGGGAGPGTLREDAALFRAAGEPGRSGPRHRGAGGGLLRRTRAGDSRRLPVRALPGRLEGQYTRHGPEFAVPGGLGGGAGDKICPGLGHARPARLCGQRAAGGEPRPEHSTPSRGS